MPVSPSRRVAFDVLRQVARGGHASDLLRAETESLSSRDAGLAETLALGVLRFQGQLDYLIERFWGRNPENLDLEVRLAFRLGIYQLRYLDRVPRHAAVDECVSLVKRARKRSAAGLVNAVLRKVDRRPVHWPEPAIELSLPGWLLEGWTQMFGEDTARRIGYEFLKPPVTYLRVPAERIEEAAGLPLEPTSVAGCYRLRGSACPAGFRRQDISSQAIVPLLDLRRGQRFLDLCAAPGNKTAQALETGVRAVAIDVSRWRLEDLAGLEAHLVAADARTALPFRGFFDRILVDAPCSGTGTLGRNPEIKWRLRPEELERHHARQTRLLENALRVLAPGGRLVYSTCSLEVEENERVVEAVTAAAPVPVELEGQIRRIPGRDPGDGFYAAVLVRQG
jgi:16S rRNA (cytosine967-C5)-methyltransferase